jgi:hypothetical protein
VRSRRGSRDAPQYIEQLILHGRRPPVVPEGETNGADDVSRGMRQCHEQAGLHLVVDLMRGEQHQPIAFQQEGSRRPQ